DRELVDRRQLREMVADERGKSHSRPQAEHETPIEHTAHDCTLAPAPLALAAALARVSARGGRPAALFAGFAHVRVSAFCGRTAAFGASGAFGLAAATLLGEAVGGRDDDRLEARLLAPAICAALAVR